jgi:hypothetical protein
MMLWMCLMTSRYTIENAIKEFDWWNYSMDQVGETLEDPDTQEWVADLTDDILDALGLD